jgi:hypothetical protein
MAQIPMGSFGQATVVPRPNRSSVDLSGTEAEGRAIAQLGQTGMQIADQALRQQKAERDRAEDEAAALARAKAANSVLDHELQTRGIVEGVQAEIADGSLDWRKAEEAFQTRTSSLQAPEISDLDPVAAEQFKGGLRRNSEQARLQVRTLVGGARRSEFKTQFETGLDTLGKIAGGPGADIEAINAKAEAFAPLARAAGVDGATISAKIQAFKDRNWTNQATNRLIAARGDMASIDALERDLTADDGFYAGKLDTERRNAILSQLTTEKTRLENAQRAEADKRESVAQRAINAMEAQLATGVPAPLEQRLAWLEQVRGTTFEAQAGQYVEMEKQSQALLKMAPAQQRTFLQQMQAEQQTKGATVDQQRLYAGLKSASDARIKMLREQPLQHFALNTGATIAPLDVQALASGDVGKVQAQIAERMNILATQRKQYGGEAGSQPLLPQEATMLASALKDAPPTKALDLFGALSTAFADPAAYSAAMQQISPGNPVRAVAGTLYAKQRETTLVSSGLFSGAVKANSGDIARTLLVGERVLAPAKPGEAKGAPFPMPPPKQLSTAFESQVGTAFRGNPGAYEMALQSVRAYYAGKASESGDVSGEIDEKLVGEAVRAVIGEPVEINGADVFPPWGMSADDFQDKIEQNWQGVSGALPASYSRDFDDYTLQQIGDGRYYVIGADGTFVHIAKDSPLILRVK